MVPTANVNSVCELIKVSFRVQFSHTYRKFRHQGVKSDNWIKMEFHRLDSQVNFKDFYYYHFKIKFQLPLKLLTVYCNFKKKSPLFGKLIIFFFNYLTVNSFNLLIVLLPLSYYFFQLFYLGVVKCQKKTKLNIHFFYNNNG